jgi:hypothetical protein
MTAAASPCTCCFRDRILFKRVLFVSLARALWLQWQRPWWASHRPCGRACCSSVPSGPQTAGSNTLAAAPTGGRPSSSQVSDTPQMRGILLRAERLPHPGRDTHGISLPLPGARRPAPVRHGTRLAPVH